MTSRPSGDQAIFDIMLLPPILALVGLGVIGYSHSDAVPIVYAVIALSFWFYRVSKYETNSN